MTTPPTIAAGDPRADTRAFPSTADLLATQTIMHWDGTQYQRISWAEACRFDLARAAASGRPSSMTQDQCIAAFRTSFEQQVAAEQRARTFHIRSGLLLSAVTAVSSGAVTYGVASKSVWPVVGGFAALIAGSYGWLQYSWGGGR